MAKGHLAVIEAQAGIAVDPATGLFFIGDTDTGMYLTDPGEIMFRADGQDILRVQQLGGDTYVDSLAFETHINRRAIIYSATETPRLQLDLVAEGRAAIEFESSVAGGDGAIRYFDPTDTPGLPSEMQFRVGDESIVHMLADSVEIDGDLILDGGDLTVDGDAAITGNLVASGQLRGRETLLVGNAPGTANNRVMYFPTNNPADSHYYLWADAAGAGSDSTRLWLDGPNGGEVVIGPRSSGNRFGQVRLRANSVVIDTPPYSGSTGYPVWHQGNLDLRVFSWTPTLVTTGDPMTISYTTRVGSWARVGSLVYVTGHIVVASVSGGTGNLRVGLPFITGSSEADRGSVGLIIGNANSWPSNTSSLLALAMAGEARLGVYAAGPTTGISSFTPANIKAGTTIRFGGWYFTDDATIGA